MKVPTTVPRRAGGADPPRWHALHPAEVARRLATSHDGLDPTEVAARRTVFGPNALPEAPRRSLAALVVAQVRSPLIFLLFAAAGVAVVVGERTDALVILLVVALNTAMGAFQEGRAERSMETLRRLAELRVRVRRAGQDVSLPARDLVPGDVLLLQAGDAVGADARLLQASALQVDEAALTGESLPVAKSVTAVPPGAILAERTSMVYGGTHVAAGRGVAVAVAIGPSSEVGNIAHLAQAEREPPTPLQGRIDQLGRWIMWGALAVFLVVMVLGRVRGLPTADILMVAISQVVGLIPEGLPVAMTIAFAVGMQRMAARGAIVRRLAAVETLGSTSVICSDKTGTLTCNEMTVTAVWLSGRPLLRVSGVGYGPEGEVRQEERVVTEDADLAALASAGVLCNDARVLPPDADGAGWRALGDPTEASLLVLARKAGVVPEAVAAAWPRTSELPFDAARKMMATAHRDAAGNAVVAIKGAPEVVLDLCGTVRVAGQDLLLDAERTAEALRAAEAMAGEALRVLALATLEGEVELAAEPRELQGRAVFLGLVGQMDPPRPEALDAVRVCQAAGMRAMMVTGDHKATGLAVARQLGIARPGDEAVGGHELAAMTDDELHARLGRVQVFARVPPDQKLRIVRALQARGETVAMTGDGVNDAPALAAADVGVAMGRGGTDVARETARIVLTDDNFATIVRAVEEGRIVYGNLRKLLLLLFSTSLAEVLVLLAAVALGYPLPFAAVQILWNNVVTEGLITVNLAMEPGEGHEMRRRPVPRGVPLLTRDLLMRMALMTSTITVVTFGYFVWRLAGGASIAAASTGTFTLLAVCEWFNVLNCRSERASALSPSLLRNPWLLGGVLAGNALQLAVVYLPAMNVLFHTVPIPLTDAVVIGLCGSLVLWVEEGRKALMRRRRGNVGPRLEPVQVAHVGRGLVPRRSRGGASR